MRRDARIPILYLAPWVDYGGTDKGTIDWFRWLDRDRYAPSLITTQPSENRRLAEVLPFADEVWALPDLMSGSEMPRFIFDFLHTRQVEVLHVMNSRLGYELLPDLGCLSAPPKVVVQLHVEEADRSGYVRYVTSRYGNLVDAFSVTSEHLADAVDGYGVSRDKIHVIYTGVDAEGEFDPARTDPVDGLAPDRVHILFPGRLVEQKDPLLMTEIAAALRDKGLPFQIHAVGEGELEDQVRAEIEQRDLGDHVLIHPPTTRLQRWYSACDVLLMTSTYEGVPYVVYEAMAMGLPVVAPALPGNVELVGDLVEGLVEPRDDVDGYTRRLGGLIEDAERRQELGRRGRERVVARFSLQQMGAEHARLYRDLIPPPPKTAEPSSRAQPPGPIRFTGRRLHETPLVSVIVPCFNHGRLLPDALEAIRAQTHPAVETIVVDDASTESATVALIDQLEQSADLTVLRLSENGGPSRARNAGLRRANGRYVLPVDADNILLPDAIERLVEQIKGAGEEVGFIYPNLQYFGNREDYFEAPDWDLYALMHRNVCDVCSLFDRDVFDAGELFDEDIRVGHEDWEFVLRLAARGVRGEPAQVPTVRYRKIGFNRSDSVEHAAESFMEAVRRKSVLHRREVAVKSRWSPALSIIALEPVDATSEAGRRLARRLADQSCLDVELIARFDGEWPAPRPEPAVRRLPPQGADSPGAALADALSVARGRFLVITSGTGTSLLSDLGFAEKVLRLLAPKETPSELDGLVLADAGADGVFPLQLLGDGVRGARPHTIALTLDAEERLPDPLPVDAGDPVGSLVRMIATAGLRTQWRHVELFARPEQHGAGGDVPLPRRSRRKRRGGDEGETWRRWPVVLPSMPGNVPRWGHASSWTPPQSMPLIRHRHRTSERRMVTMAARPPRGYEPEYELGSVRIFSLEGTRRLLALGTGDYATAPRGAWDAAPPGSTPLGYLETVAFPLLEALVVARHPETGQQVLVSGARDPLLPAVDPIETLGFLEALPANPPRPHADDAFGLVGLTKTVDRGARRHRVAVGAVPEGALVGELGALAEWGQPPAIPAWVIDGCLVTDRHRPPARGTTARAAARWALAPLRWRGFSKTMPKVRAMARRSFDSLPALARGRGHPPEPAGSPAGWLLGEGLPWTVPLYAAYHPVNGDQLLTTSGTEPTDMGYGQPELLGHLWASAPLTGSLEQRVVAVPWASRFGLQARRA